MLADSRRIAGLGCRVTKLRGSAEPASLPEDKPRTWAVACDNSAFPPAPTGHASRCKPAPTEHAARCSSPMAHGRQDAVICACGAHLSATVVRAAMLARPTHVFRHILHQRQLRHDVPTLGGCKRQPRSEARRVGKE